MTTPREKLKRYNEQQEATVSQIAIQNILEAKHRELRERRHEDLAALNHHPNLVPALLLVELATILGDHM